jgi:hypothetical protein
VSQLPWARSAEVPPEEAAAAAAVKRAVEIPPRPVELSAGWDGVLERAMKPERSPGRWLVVAVPVALLLAVSVKATLAVRPHDEAPALVASTAARWDSGADGGVQLTAGRLETTRRVAMTLESPQVTLWTDASRFAAEVVAEGTRVTVFEGEVFVRSGGEVRTLRAGESGLWPVTPPLPKALELNAPPPSSCGDDACLEAAAQGEELGAEVALFELGRLAARSGDDAAALAHWQRSLARFPDGVFTPELRLSVLGALTRQRRFTEAAAVAREFEQRYPDDPRVPDVTRFRQTLER